MPKLISSMVTNCTSCRSDVFSLFDKIEASRDGTACNTRMHTYKHIYLHALKHAVTHTRMGVCTLHPKAANILTFIASTMTKSTKKFTFLRKAQAYMARWCCTYYQVVSFASRICNKILSSSYNVCAHSWSEALRHTPSNAEQKSKQGSCFR